MHHLVRKVGQRFDAIICLGVILKGDTFHFEMITPEVFSGLARLSLEIDIPIIVEILPVLEVYVAIALGVSWGSLILLTRRSPRLT